MKPTLRAAVLGGCLAWVACTGSGGSSTEDLFGSATHAMRHESKVAGADWPQYLGDAGRTHSSVLTQINAANVNELEVAWTYDTGPLSSALSQIQCNPIVVDGTLYATTPRSEVFALDAATGAEKWRFNPVEHGSTSQGLNRGVVYWQGPSGGRIMLAAGQDLWALDAKTGEPIPSFGSSEDSENQNGDSSGGGRVDLRIGLAHGSEGGDVTSPTPGAVFEDLLIVGTKVGETEGSAPGDIRAYDLNTGALRWVFHTVPRAGEFGVDSWPDDAWKTQGGANSWAGATLDTERGIVFLPTGSATPDFWGGDRAGANLFANSLLALNARTGERIWHFQFVHHDLWDRDLPTAPTLVRFERNGDIVDAVAQPTKSGHLFVFDRETGEPVFPIEEQPVRAGMVEGQWTSPTQPIPTAPPPFTRQKLEIEPSETRVGLLEKTEAYLEGMHVGENFVPPSLEGSVMYPGFDGGAEWGGAAWDEETGLLFVNANEVGAMLRLMERGKGGNPKSIYAEKCGICHGQELEGTGVGPSLRGIAERRTPVEIYTAIALGGGRMPGFLDMPFPTMERLTAFLLDPDNVEKALAALDARAGSNSRYVSAGYVYLRDEDGIPVNSPPWGTLTAIDLAAGELRWQIPLGEYPQLAARGLGNTGTENYGGPIVTASGLLFIAASADEKFRAFDKRTGDELWSAKLPAAGYATPATYSVDGRQFVVIAAGGGKLGTQPGSKYIAYSLPVSAMQPSAGGN